MNPYFVVATDSSGQRVSFAREATSVDHLRRQLEADGYRDIAFEDDDFTVALRQQQPDDLPEADESILRLESKLRRGPAKGATFLLWLRNNAIFLLLGAAAVAFGLATARIWLAVGGGMLIAFPLVHFLRWQGRTDRYVEQLRAYATGDWERVEQLIAAMRRDPGQAAIEALQADLRFRAAGVRARRGELDAALADVAPLRHTAAGANGMYEMRVASIRCSADDTDGFLEQMHAGWEASGRTQVMQLDLAFAHARLGDAQRAAELLAGVDRRTLSTMHRPIAEAIDGLLAVRAGDAAAGIERLRAGVAGFDEFAGNPASWPIMGILAGHLALALLDAGRRDEARAALAPWRDVAPHWIGPAARRRLETELSA